MFWWFPHMHALIGTLLNTQGDKSLELFPHAAFSLQSSVLCTLVTMASPDSQLYLLITRRPMGSAWVFFPVLHLGNYLKTISCSNNRAFLICPLSLRIIVLHCLNSNILKTFASHILFFFCLFQAGNLLLQLGQK